MKYEILVLDLDGTLTNSRKEISEATKKGLLKIQKTGKIIVLASGRPVNGVAPIAEELEIIPVKDFPSAITFPVNKMIISGDPSVVKTVITPL